MTRGLNLQMAKTGSINLFKKRREEEVGEGRKGKDLEERKGRGEEETRREEETRDKNRKDR